VQELNPSVTARDQPVALERPQDNSDGRTLHAEHHGEELLLECGGIVLDAVARLEQPTAGTLGDVVPRVARGALHDLQQARLCVQIDEVAEGTGDGGLFHETRCSHRRQEPIRDLPEGPADAGPIAKEHTDPQHAFPPDRGHFDKRTVPHFVGDGEHTAVREIDVLDARAVRMQRMTGPDGRHPPRIGESGRTRRVAVRRGCAHSDEVLASRAAAVLVVDDVEDVRELVALVLRNAGFVVRTAVNCLEGLLTAYEMRPDVIIMDFTMPVLNGLEATRLIKATHSTRESTVIAYTANGSIPPPLERWFVAIISKPSPPDVVLAAVPFPGELDGSSHRGRGDRSRNRCCPYGEPVTCSSCDAP